MELVYLWVEDYKNIHKQGFNFSPRFECKFHDEYDEDGKLKDGCELEIIEKKENEYIKDFFGENINVTAIVGKNGSGKSSVLSAYTQIYNMFYQALGYEQETHYNTEEIVSILILKLQDYKVVFTNIKIEFQNDSFIKLFFQENKEVVMCLDFIYEDSNLQLKNDWSANKEFISELMTTYPKLLLYDNYFSKFKPQNETTWIGGKENEFYNKNSLMIYQNILIVPNKIGDNLIEENEEIETKNLFNYFIIKKDDKYIEETNTFFEPNEIFISKNEKYIDKNIANIETFVDFEIYVIKEYLKEIIQEAFKDIDEKKVLEPYKKDLENPNFTLTGNKNKNKLLNELEKSLNLGIFLYEIKSNFFLSTLEPILRLSYEKEFELIQEYLNINLDNNRKNKLLKFYFIDKKKSHNIKVDTSILEESDLDFFLKLPKCFKINIFNKNDIEYIHLSSGEKELLKIRFYIENYIYENKNHSYFILLDEPTNYLHPNWQKRLINFFINVFKKRKEKIHFIVTTHSPFLLSDIPKQNIIFLDRYKEDDEEVKNGKQEIGNCKILTHEKVLEKKQTFGANIHTLLSDSFFMKDGLMGEFAKGKINEIIDFHKEVETENKKEEPNFVSLQEKYKNNKTKFWSVQSIIGEDYLKQVIKNHLRDIENILLGYDEAKQEEIKRLREEADRLERM